MTHLRYPAGLGAALLIATQAVWASGAGDHAHGEDAAADMLRSMEQMHAEHDHGHDFEAMRGIPKNAMYRTIDFLTDIGLVVPPMNSERGARAFMSTGCVVCHAVNGVGGQVGPAFDADAMPQPMNVFDFAARMWRGAPAMSRMQEDLLGEMIALDGQELADIAAFVHDGSVQGGISEADIPDKYRALMP